LKRDGRVDGLLQHGRGAAADEEEDDAAGGHCLQQGERSAGGVRGDWAGDGVLACEELRVGPVHLVLCGRNDNSAAANFVNRAEELFAGGVHAGRCLAYGDRDDLIDLGERDHRSGKNEGVRADGDLRRDTAV
jgi:hypothetical protein